MNLPISSFNKAYRNKTVLLTLVLFAGCSSGGGDSAPKQMANNPDTTVSPSEVGGSLLNDGTWMLEDKLFVSGGEDVRTQSNQPDRVVIVVGDDASDNSNGEYSGGSLRITLTPTGSGVYSVDDVATIPAVFGNGSKVASISVTAGTLSNNASQWATTAASGTVSVSENSEGRYFVSTTEPLILTRQRDIGTGIPDSADQVLLSMRNINGLVIQ